MKSINNVIIKFDEDEVREALNRLHEKYNKLSKVVHPLHVISGMLYVFMSVSIAVLLLSVLGAAEGESKLYRDFTMVITVFLCLFAWSANAVYKMPATWLEDNKACRDVANLSTSEMLCIPAMQEQFSVPYMLLLSYAVKGEITDITISSRGDLLTAIVVEEDDKFSDLNVVVGYSDSVPSDAVLLTPTAAYVNRGRYERPNNIKVTIS